MELTKDFDLAEFIGKDGAEIPSGYLDNVRQLAGQLQKLRDYLDKAVRINSGYRTPEHNREIGGVDNSYHTYAMAADISVQDTTPGEVYCAIKHLIARGGSDGMQDGGLGWYGDNGHIHYDIGHVRRWTKPVGLALPVCPPPKEEDEVKQAELDKLNARLDELDAYRKGSSVYLGELAKRQEEGQAFHDGIGKFMGGAFSAIDQHSEIIVNHEGRLVELNEELDEVQVFIEGMV